MKATDPFKRTIQAYLEQYATTDELFADKLQNPLKNIDDCITYILNEVKKSGCNGFEDDEIFNMAIHYYDEDKIEVGKPISGKVVVNHHVVITDEEKQELRDKAISELFADEKRRLTQKKSTTMKVVEVQGSLF
jgi:hypothetical protein